MESNYMTVNNAKDKEIIGDLVLAFDKNYGTDGLYETHIDAFLDIFYRHEVKESDNVRYYLSEAIWNDDGTTDELINETVSIFVQNDFEAGMEAYDDYRDGDHDGYYEKQYYQNPKGLCEDAPCCGCCGMM
jgi:hypothetical protein